MVLETMLSVNSLSLYTGVISPSKKDMKVVPVLDWRISSIDERSLYLRISTQSLSISIEIDRNLSHFSRFPTTSSLDAPGLGLGTRLSEGNENVEWKDFFAIWTDSFLIALKYAQEMHHGFRW